MTQLQTPYLRINKTHLVENCQRFQRLFDKHSIYYSVKANSTPDVLAILVKQGIGFDVASWEEIVLLHNLGVSPDRMVFSAPTKKPTDIEAAYALGVRTYAFDSKMEVEKLADLAPGSRVIGRLIVDNTGSEWPLIRKFGMTVEETLTFVTYAKKLGLVPHGLSFHVGSQNLQAETWKKALEKACMLWKELQKKGIRIPVINTGGGFPVEYTKKVPSVTEIAKVITGTVEKLFQNQVTLYVEPGRSMAGNTGILVATVINRAPRGLAEWLYLDTGVYHGFQETLEGFKYTVTTDKKSTKKRKFVLCGPTCDSTDIIMEEAYLPESMTLGDKVYFSSCGAYSTSYEYYNGFRYPKTVIE